MEFNLTRASWKYWDKICDNKKYSEKLKRFNYSMDKDENIKIEINSLNWLLMFIESFWDIIIHKDWELVIYDDYYE